MAWKKYFLAEEAQNIKDSIHVDCLVIFFIL